MRRWKMVVCGSFRPFLSSLGTRRVRTPFSFYFLVLLAQKNMFAIFLYNFSCSSCVGEFSRHFVCRKLLHVAGFFFHGKKFLRKKIFAVFSPWNWKTMWDFQRERKLRNSAKMRKNGSTVTVHYEESMTVCKTHCLVWFGLAGWFLNILVNN